MVSTLEALFRRLGRLLFLLLFLPIVSVAVVYFLVPRIYQSSATLWALHRYVVIGATGQETDLTSNPAQTQADALNELLQSRTFDLTIASETELASTFSASTRANQQQLDDAIYGDISQKVLASPQGYNVIMITYTNQAPKVAQKVVQAVIQNFNIQSQNFTNVEAQKLLTAYQSLLEQAKQAEQQAVAAEAQYLQSHPNLTPTNLLNDPHYTLLHSATQQAQVKVQNIQNTIDAIQQEVAEQGTGQQYLFQVLDAPTLPVQALSRTKTFLAAGGVGVGVALLACVLYILIVVRRDRSVRTTLDLKKVSAIPVVLEMPHLSPKSPLLRESMRDEVS